MAAGSTASGTLACTVTCVRALLSLSHAPDNPPRSSHSPRMCKGILTLYVSCHTQSRCSACACSVIAKALIQVSTTIHSCFDKCQLPHSSHASPRGVTPRSHVAAAAGAGASPCALRGLLPLLTHTWRWWAAACASCDCTHGSTWHPTRR